MIMLLYGMLKHEEFEKHITPECINSFWNFIIQLTFPSIDTWKLEVRVSNLVYNQIP